MQFGKMCFVPFVLFLSSCATTPKIGSGKNGEWEIIPIIGKIQAYRTVLNNGLKLVVVEDHKSPTFSYQTWFKVGSKNEDKGKTGLAHFFEHMMFRGTKNHPQGDFDRLSEAAGVEGGNAFTSSDFTAYVQQFPKNSLDLIIGLESDRMVNLVVDEQGFNTERGAIFNEKRMSRDNNPDGILNDALYDMIFTNSAYHWPVIGYDEDLTNVTYKDAQEFYKKHYSPDHATIVVVGDVEAESIFDKIKAAYGSIPASGIPSQVLPVDEEQTAQKRKKLSLNLENEKLHMAFRIGAYKDPETPVYEIIQSILTDLRSSRLKRALVDSGICSRVNSGNEGLEGPGFYIIQCDLQQGKKAALAEAIIQGELKRLAKSNVTDAELNRAKMNYQFNFLKRLQEPTSLSSFIGDAETTLGDVRIDLKVNQDALKVTADQVREVAAKTFDSKHMTVLVGVPK